MASSISVFRRNNWLRIGQRLMSSSNKIQPSKNIVDSKFIHEALRALAHTHRLLSQDLIMEGMQGPPSPKVLRTMQRVKSLEPAELAYRSIENKIAGIHELKKIVKFEEDREMLNLARSETRILEEELAVMEKKAMPLLVEPDPDDTRNVVLEVRAGTGGEEAALFTQEIFTMYERFAAAHSWQFEVLQTSKGEAGGLKEASALIKGEGVFGFLKFEVGVHRVQRVPATESSGRVHTSAMSVAALPEALPTDCEMNSNDLRFDVYRSQGAGGQSVNTTDSAVRVVHVPTGITVCMQDERSQHKNRAKAVKVLQSRLYAAQREKIHEEQRKKRNSQMGSGNRNERIRTYNFPQGRVTDHRITFTKHGIEKMLNGHLLDQFVQALRKRDLDERLRELVKDHIKTDTTK